MPSRNVSTWRCHGSVARHGSAPLHGQRGSTVLRSGIEAALDAFRADHGRSALPRVIRGHDAVDMVSVTRAAIAGTPAPEEPPIWYFDTVMDPITWLMSRKMPLGIRKRADGRDRAQERDDAGRDRGDDADGLSNAPKNPTASDGLSRWDRRTRQRLAEDVRSMERDDRSHSSEPVTDADLEPLPEPAQRYLRWARVLGRPRDRAFTARFVGRFRMRPDQRWMPYRSWQFNATDPVTRLIHMRVDVAGVVPMFGTDSYLDQRGRMHGKVLGLVTVADGAGPEFDMGELVTYVNDAAMLAPSMLLTPRCEWTPVDDDSFDLTFTDDNNTVRARMFVDDDGRLLDFRTDDRWFAGVDPPVRTTWSTPIERWTTRRDGRPIPASGSAVWHLPDAEFTYVRGAFDPELVQFDTVDGPGHRRGDHTDAETTPRDATS